MSRLDLVEDVSVLQHGERHRQLGAAHPHVDEAEASLRRTGLVHVAVRVDHDEAGGDEQTHSAWHLFGQDNKWNDKFLEHLLGQGWIIDF